MIVNVRGTSGSGKSTLAHRLLDLYEQRIPLMGERKQPLGYTLTAASRPSLFVLGHYEIAGGGADNVSNRDRGFELLTNAVTTGLNVFWEGLIYSDDSAHTVELAKLDKMHVILLTTPIQQCIDDINARRRLRGNDKKVDEKNTRKRIQPINNACDRLRLSALRIPIERLDREAAFLRCRELLQI